MKKVYQEYFRQFSQKYSWYTFQNEQKDRHQEKNKKMVQGTLKGRFVEITEQGGPEVMQVNTVDFPAPCEGEVLIRQQALGMNFLDVYHRSGAYQIPLPSGIGTEAAGVVEAVGPGVTDVKEGDLVAYGGGLPAGRFIPIPEGVSNEVAGKTKGPTLITI